MLPIFELCGWKTASLKGAAWKTSCVNISVLLPLLICYSSPTPSPLCDSRLFTSPSEKALCSLKFPSIRLQGGPLLSFAAACRALALPSVGIKTKWSLIFSCQLTRCQAQQEGCSSQGQCVTARISGGVIPIFGNGRGYFTVDLAGTVIWTWGFVLVSNLFWF